MLIMATGRAIDHSRTATRRWKRRAYGIRCLKGFQCGSNFENRAETPAGKGQNDLVGLLKSYLNDGYQETMSLGCEFELPGLSHMETSKRSVEGLLQAMSIAAGARNS